VLRLSCADLITQVSAGRESLQTIARNLMCNHLHHCAVKATHGEGRRTARGDARRGATHDEGMTREAMVDESMN